MQKHQIEPIEWTCQALVQCIDDHVVPSHLASGLQGFAGRFHGHAKPHQSKVLQQPHMQFDLGSKSGPGLT